MRNDPVDPAQRRSEIVASSSRVLYFWTIRLRSFAALHAAALCAFLKNGQTETVSF